MIVPIMDSTVLKCPRQAPDSDLPILNPSWAAVRKFIGTSLFDVVVLHCTERATI